MKRRAELAGEANAIRNRLAQITTDTGHLDAVIRQFDPEYDTAAIRPKRPRNGDVAKRGERSRVLLDVLRKTSEPITTAEVVRRVLTVQGKDPADKALVRQVSKRFEAALARQERLGVVQAIREPGQMVVWGWQGSDKFAPTCLYVRAMFL